ncbi:MAG: DUF362 domain-containing protein [Salinivirgaceae bacterium]|jgi:uncharacterized protein (DUF362 family)|nr:DUF362 domain-containing protein [Salinivirgaceae bacterium]
MKTLEQFKLLSGRKVLASLVKNRNKLVAIAIGAMALIWFVIRVIPKPQRASYPCQRAAFPIASAFIIWIIGIISSKAIYTKAKKALSNKQLLRSTLLMSTAIGIFMFSTLFSQIFESSAMGLQFFKLKQIGNELYATHKDAVTENIIEPEAIVGIVQSDKSDAYDIDFEELNTMVREAVNLAGGFDTLIHEGDTVVLKPNVISSRSESGVIFPQTANGIATDYRIIQIVANMVRELNTTGQIFIIEASGNGVTRKNFEELGYFNVTGIDSIILLDEFEGDWYDTSAPDLVEVNLPEGKNLYPSGNKYYMHNIYKNAQVVISLPCLKSHGLTGITGGVKNVGIGATPVRIYGFGPNEPEIYRSARWGRIDHGDYSTTAAPLDRWIHDFYMCRPVDYVIMDGLQGAEYGPYPGGMTGANVALSSVQKNMRIMLAGKDALAVDAVHALIVGVDPYLVGHLQFLAQDEIGCINPALIKINGTQVHEIKKSFKEQRPGNFSQYSDFDAPWVGVPNPCSINNETLNIALAPDADVEKIEVAYNDTILTPIIVNNFESITLPLESYQTDISKVKVLACDKYLNCSTFTPDKIILSASSKEIKPLKVFPIPASDNIIIASDEIGNADILVKVVSINGQLMLTQQVKLNTNGLYELNISVLPAGNYVINASAGKKLFSTKFIKTGK